MGNEAKQPGSPTKDFTALRKENVQGERMGKQRLAWKSENHPTSLDDMWGKAAFNEGVQGFNSPLAGTPLQTKTAPAAMPHASQQPRCLWLAVRPGWAFCPLLFHTMNTLKLYTRHCLFQIGNRIAGYVSRHHCSQFLSSGVQSLSSAQKGKVKSRSPGQDYQTPGTSLSLAILQLH